MSSSPEKKQKTEDGPSAPACLVDDKGNIPIKTVSRMLHVRVSGEKDAVAAQEVLRAVHEMMRAEVKGVQKGLRFVCKEHWDVRYVAVFDGVPALEGYMGGDARKKVEGKVDELAKKISLVGGVHWQNYVVDEWN